MNFNHLKKNLINASFPQCESEKSASAGATLVLPSDFVENLESVNTGQESHDYVVSPHYSIESVEVKFHRKMSEEPLNPAINQNTGRTLCNHNNHQ